MDLFPRGRKSGAGEGKGASTTPAGKQNRSATPATDVGKGGASALAGNERSGLFGTAVVTKKRSKSTGSVVGTGSKLAKKAKGVAGGGASLGEAASAAGMVDDFDDAGGMLRLVTNPSGKGKKTEKVTPPIFKQLVAGTLMFGLVKRVTRRQLFVALPYGLSGLVSVGEVSDQRLFEDGDEEESDEDEEEHKMGDDDDDDDADADGADAEPASKEKSGSAAKASPHKRRAGRGGQGQGGSSSSLESLFTVGQALRCCVVGTSSTKHGRKSVSLTLKPSVVNRGLFLEHLRPGCPAYGAVVSVEDHGYVVSLGMEGAVTGFLRKQDCEHSHQPKNKNSRSQSSSAQLALSQPPRVGQPLDMAVLSNSSLLELTADSASSSASSSAAPRTVHLTTRKDLVASARPQGSASSSGPGSKAVESLPIRALKPGALVSARVLRVAHNGLVVSFLHGTGKSSGSLVGVIHENHLAVPCKQEHWKLMYKAGDALPACRLLTLDYASRAFTLTLRPHLLSLSGLPAALPPPGLVIEKATVLRVDPKEGILLGVPAGLLHSTSAVASRSGALGEEEDGGEAAAAEEEEATTETDTAKKKRLKQLKANEAAAGGKGMLVGCYVPLARVASAEARGAGAAFAAAAADGNGGVPKKSLWRVEKEFEVGATVRCRVVAANILEGMGVATMVAAEVDSSVLSRQELVPGQVLKGPILAAESWGVLIDLGGDSASGGGAADSLGSGGARALVTPIHLADAAVSDPKKRFRVGAKVTCRLLTVEKGGRQVHATMKKALVTDPLPPLMSYEELYQTAKGSTSTSKVSKVTSEVGRSVQGFVSRVTAHGLLVTFYHNVYGLVQTKTLASQGVDTANGEEGLSAAFQVGQVIRCRVLHCAPAPLPRASASAASSTLLRRPKRPSLLLALDMPGTLPTSHLENEEEEVKEGNDADSGGGGRLRAGGQPLSTFLGTLVGGTILSRELSSSSSSSGDTASSVPGMSSAGGEELGGGSVAGGSSVGGGGSSVGWGSGGGKGSGKGSKRAAPAAHLVMELDAPLEGVKAVLPLVQLGDFGGLSSCFGATSPEFAPGKRVEGMLVLKVPPEDDSDDDDQAAGEDRDNSVWSKKHRRHTPPVLLTKKPLLLLAAAANAAAEGGGGKTAACSLHLPHTTDAVTTSLKLKASAAASASTSSATSLSALASAKDGAELSKKASARRQGLEAKSLKALSASALVCGFVRAEQPFGMFVECGQGTAGMVPRAQLCWESRFVEQPCVALGDVGNSVVCALNRPVTAASTAAKAGEGEANADRKQTASEERLVLSAKPSKLPCSAASAALVKWALSLPTTSTSTAAARSTSSASSLACGGYLGRLLAERFQCAKALAELESSSGGALVGGGGGGSAAVAKGGQQQPLQLQQSSYQLPDFERYPLGTTTDGTVTERRPDGTLLLLATDGRTVLAAPPPPPPLSSPTSSSSKKSKAKALSKREEFLHAASPGAFSIGDVVKVRVLDCSFGPTDARLAPAHRAASALLLDLPSRTSLPSLSHGALVVSCVPSLVKAGRTKRRKAAATAFTGSLFKPTPAASPAAATAVLAVVGEDEKDGGELEKEKKKAKKLKKKEAAAALAAAVAAAEAEAAAALLRAGAVVQGTVLLVEPAWGYAVVAVASGDEDSGEKGKDIDDNGAVLGYLMLADYSCPSLAVDQLASLRTDANEPAASTASGEDSLIGVGGGLEVGSQVACKVLSAPCADEWFSGSSPESAPHKHALFLRRASDAAAADALFGVNRKDEEKKEQKKKEREEAAALAKVAEAEAELVPKFTAEDLYRVLEAGDATSTMDECGVHKGAIWPVTAASSVAAADTSAAAAASTEEGEEEETPRKKKTKNALKKEAAAAAAEATANLSPEEVAARDQAAKLQPYTGRKYYATVLSMRDDGCVVALDTLEADTEAATTPAAGAADASATASSAASSAACSSLSTSKRHQPWRVLGFVNVLDLASTPEEARQWGEGVHSVTTTTLVVQKALQEPEKLKKKLSKAKATAASSADSSSSSKAASVLSYGAATVVVGTVLVVSVVGVDSANRKVELSACRNAKAKPSSSSSADQGEDSNKILCQVLHAAASASAATSGQSNEGGGGGKKGGAGGGGSSAAVVKGGPAVMVALPGRGLGRVCISELKDADSWRSLPVDAETGCVRAAAPSELSEQKGGDPLLVPGSFRWCTVLKGSGGGGSAAEATDLTHMECSLRPSRIDAAANAHPNQVLEYLAERVPALAASFSSSSSSSAPSSSAASASWLPLPKVGDLVQGFVIKTQASAGCFVRLRHHLEGRVLIKDLSDQFVASPTKSFPPGMLVAGKVTSVGVVNGSNPDSGDKKKRKGGISQKCVVGLTLRPSVVLGDRRKANAKRLGVGSVCKGVVTRVEDFGVFVALLTDGNKVPVAGGGLALLPTLVKAPDTVTGLCHISEAADSFIKDLPSVYSAGDLVKCKVLRVSGDKGTVSLGLKASYFEGEAESSDDDDEEEEEESESDEDGSDDEDEDAGEAVEDDGDSEDENFAANLKKKLLAEEEGDEEDGSDDEEEDDEDEEEVEDDDDDDEDEEEEDDSAPSSLGKRPSATGAFTWDDFSVGQTKNKNQGPNEASAHDDEDEDEDDSGDENGSSARALSDLNPSSKKKQKKQTQKQQGEEDKEDQAAVSVSAVVSEEERMKKREQALLEKAGGGAGEDGGAGSAPETTTEGWSGNDFERELMARPNSSEVWVRFMASKLEVHDVSGCRALGYRALKTIGFREEDEKFNVWVALVNFEHRFGTREDLGKAIVSACQQSHPKKIRLRVASMFEEAALAAQATTTEAAGTAGLQLDGEACAEAESAYAAAAKKHKTSKQVWSAYVRWRLRRGDSSGAAEVLRRGLQSLSPHKHVFVVARMATDEYGFGSVERGRTVFEELLASHAKRLDLWNVYIDKEIKAGELQGARQLFRRLTTMKSLGAKHTKGVFKKWLGFEKVHGTSAQQQVVKDQARAYVARELESSTATPGVAAGI